MMYAPESSKRRADERIGLTARYLQSSSRSPKRRHCGEHRRGADTPKRVSARLVGGVCELLRGGCVEPLEPVAVVVDRHHAVTGLGLEVELLADLADVGIDGARGEIGAAAPHGFLKVAAREQPSHVAEERDRQLELLRRQVNLRA